MKLKVSHTIRYTFEPPRRRFLQSLRLTPTECDGQRVIDWSVTVSDGRMGAGFLDGAGDYTATVSVPGPVEEMVVEVRGEVETYDTLGVLRGGKGKVPPMAYLAESRLARPDAAITLLAKAAVATIDPELHLDRAHALSQAVTGALTLDPEAIALDQTAAEALETGKGGYGDHAHLLIAAAHSLDIPARFVWGYCYVEGGGPQDLVVETEDASGVAILRTVHAWAELWVDGLGWTGFDPASECCPDETYIRLCSGRDAIDAAPMRGLAMGVGNEGYKVTLDVSAVQQ